MFNFIKKLLNYQSVYNFAFLSVVRLPVCPHLLHQLTLLHRAFLWAFSMDRKLFVFPLGTVQGDPRGALARSKQLKSYNSPRGSPSKTGCWASPLDAAASELVTGSKMQRAARVQGWGHWAGSGCGTPRLLDQVKVHWWKLWERKLFSGVLQFSKTRHFQIIFGEITCALYFLLIGPYKHLGAG